MTRAALLLQLLLLLAGCGGAARRPASGPSAEEGAVRSEKLAVPTAGPQTVPAAGTPPAETDACGADALPAPPSAPWSGPEGYGPSGYWERIHILPQGDTVRRAYSNISDTAIRIDETSGRIVLFEGNNRRDFMVERIRFADGLCTLEARPDEPDDPEEGPQRFRCRHLDPYTALWSYGADDNPAGASAEALFTLRPERYELQIVPWDKELEPASDDSGTTPEPSADPTTETCHR